MRSTNWPGVTAPGPKGTCPSKALHHRTTAGLYFFSKFAAKSAFSSSVNSEARCLIFDREAARRVVFIGALGVRETKGGCVGPWVGAGLLVLGCLNRDKKSKYTTTTTAAATKLFRLRFMTAFRAGEYASARRVSCRQPSRVPPRSRHNRAYCHQWSRPTISPWGGPH